MILYVLVVFSMAGNPVMLVKDLDAETCLKAQQRVDETMFGSTQYYAECIVQSTTHSL